MFDVQRAMQELSDRLDADYRAMVEQALAFESRCDTRRPLSTIVEDDEV